MNEQRLERMEDMLSHLITMFGIMNETLGRIEGKVARIETRLDRIETKVNVHEESVINIQQEQRDMRSEIMNKLQDMQADQNHIWEKVARKERELAILKSLLQL